MLLLAFWYLLTLPKFLLWGSMTDHVSAQHFSRETGEDRRKEITNRSKRPGQNFDG